jgi:AcrR family transcriptional regulator
VNTEPCPPDRPARPSPSGSRPRRSQAQRRQATRDALLSAGRRLFAERGVAAVSTEELVTEAGVTRGSLYHHFQDKNDLFLAVFVQLEEQVCAEMTALIDAEDNVIAGLQRGLGRFLDLCERSDVRRIGLLDAPAVLGWAQWRRIETQYALGVLTERLRAAERQGASLPGPVEAVGSMLFAAVIDAALTIADADDPVATRTQIEPTLYLLAIRVLGVGPAPVSEP